MTDYLQMAHEAFTTSTTFFDSSIRKQIESNLRQFQGVHPSGSKYHSDTYKARSRLFRPKTRTTIRKNEATAAEALFSTNDVVSVTPQDDTNPIQLASAAVMQQLLGYRLKKSIPWFLTAIGAYQDAQTVGICISHQNWLYNERKKIDMPGIELLPLENVRISPGANWADPINSSPYVIRMIPMYVKDVKARMKADGKTGEPKWATVDDSKLLTAMNLYGDTTRLTRERGRTDSKEQSTAIKDFAIVWVHQNIIEIDGADQLYYTLGTTALLTNPVPLEKVYFHGRRPFVMGCCILETHKIYPGGVAEITKDTQAEINEIANQRIDNVKFAMNKRYFVKRGKQVDIRSLTRNVPSSVTMMDDPEKDVIVQSTIDVTSSSYQEQDRLNLDFDDIAGSFSQSSVQTNRKLNETVGGMNLLTNNANQVSSYQLRTFVETWVEPVLAQLVLLEQYYETDEVVLALAGKSAGLYQKFGIDQVTDELLMQELTTNVNVGIGSTNPQEQINAFMLGMTNLRNILADGLLEKYGLDVTEVIKELFGKLGYKDGARFFNTKDQDPSLLAAQATIQQLQQALSQKTDPALVAKQIEKLDAEIGRIRAEMVQKGVESAFSATQAGAQIAQMPMVAPVADAVLQMAGYQTPIPAGVDPNLPTAEQTAAMNMPAPYTQGQPVVPPVQQNTSPQFPPIPQQPETGMNGIETARNEPL